MDDAPRLSSAQQIIAALHLIAAHLSDIEVQLSSLNQVMEEAEQRRSSNGADNATLVSRLPPPR
jgi:hypothetical protein